MAYRRKQGITKSSTFTEGIHNPPEEDAAGDKNRSPVSTFGSPRSKGFAAYENEPKSFWGVLAQKAKSIIDDDKIANQIGSKSSIAASTLPEPKPEGYPSKEGLGKMDNPKLRRGLDKITSSLNQIGDTFEKAFEEGRTMVESKTADIIQETRKIQIRRRGTGSETPNRTYGVSTAWQQSPIQPVQQNQTDQLKASRDVAMATAAKAKLLLRELKTLKADLAFAKERCSHLEEENKHLRENREKGNNSADDDLIRLQLESLLAEKARLAHENSVYARENRFLREIVEYHQLTMQDVVYIDEGNEEVTQVYPSLTETVSSSPFSPPSPREEDDVVRVTERQPEKEEEEDGGGGDSGETVIQRHS